MLTENYLARKTFAKKTVYVAFSENNREMKTSKDRLEINLFGIYRQNQLREMQNIDSSKCYLKTP